MSLQRKTLPPKSPYCCAPLSACWSCRGRCHCAYCHSSSPSPSAVSCPTPLGDPSVSQTQALSMGAYTKESSRVFR